MIGVDGRDRRGEASLEELARTNPQPLVELVLEQEKMIVQQRAMIEALERRVSDLKQGLRESGGGA